MTKDAIEIHKYSNIINVEVFEFILPFAWAQLEYFDFSKFNNLKKLCIKTFRGTIQEVPDKTMKELQ